MTKNTTAPLIKCNGCGDPKEEGKECNTCKGWAELMQQIAQQQKKGEKITTEGTGCHFLAFNETTGKLEEITAREYYEETRTHPRAKLKKEDDKPQR